ncbi:Tca17p KNAG_0G00390 [Huiozyma naganishii CBS 8797]|uniref:Uncharacterized protein n=1 Tax=Huiozyma naganishii (strain ATCC MYA-139 / BCRC 22969 / CBS 8797 / KCTC 17520 / NBRC 10181 / NCYC 3082 / Yp74L-3) TaxID=1071383 RepID=J7S8T8_HUIN7|nr:hypothetical protein KNAG_0G00390 [Kazachstania naganishii CBS 8797]CCK71096.1 hypothetical protein KNAG_0G00390 [Kazachstania naganishii CBS 8797]
MAEVTPLFITLIGKDNRPILIHSVGTGIKDVNEELKYNTLSNISLDYFESKLFDWNISPENASPMNMLFEIEGVCVFAMWIKPTGLKIVLGFDPSLPFDRENDPSILNVFQRVKEMYSRVKTNPFLNLQDEGNEKLAIGLEEKLKAEYN